MNPLQLPSGCFCQVREVLSSPDRGLVLVVDYWDTQEAHDAGEPPRSSHDHGFGAFKVPARDENGRWIPVPDRPDHIVMAKRKCLGADDVRGRILAELSRAHMPGVRNIAVDEGWLEAVRPDGQTDHWGFLAHPHVQGLKAVAQ
jgi:hypothetical protein